MSGDASDEACDFPSLPSSLSFSIFCRISSSRASGDDDESKSRVGNDREGDTDIYGAGKQSDVNDVVRRDCGLFLEVVPVRMS